MELLLPTSISTFRFSVVASIVIKNHAKKNSIERVLVYINNCLGVYIEREYSEDKIYRTIKKYWKEGYWLIYLGVYILIGVY